MTDRAQLMRRIYAALAKPSLNIKYRRARKGTLAWWVQWDDDSETIFLDPRGKVLECLVHELIHSVLDCELNSVVDPIEKSVVGNLSNEEYRRLTVLLAEALRR